MVVFCCCFSFVLFIIVFVLFVVVNITIHIVIARGVCARPEISCMMLFISDNQKL